jgi:hypothetical protein
LTGISCVTKPEKEINSTASVSIALSAKLPFTSVTVPFADPLTLTEAPIKGSPLASSTLPLILTGGAFSVRITGTAEDAAALVITITFSLISKLRCWSLSYLH